MSMYLTYGVMYCRTWCLCCYLKLYMEPQCITLELGGACVFFFFWEVVLVLLNHTYCSKSFLIHTVANCNVPYYDITQQKVATFIEVEDWPSVFLVKLIDWRVPSYLHAENYVVICQQPNYRGARPMVNLT